MESTEKMNTAKVTDAEILKALKTPYNRKWVIADDGNGDFIRVGDIVDLVYRQKAEIERLTTMHSEMCIGMKRLKSEARKEFAEKLRNTMTATSKTTSGYCKYIVTDDEIDNLLEEMECDTE